MRKKAIRFAAPKMLGYFIGAGKQSFGSGKVYRCAWCSMVWKTLHLCEAHEKTDCKRRKPH